MEHYILALAIANFTTVTAMGAFGAYVLSQRLTLDDLAEQKTYGDRTIVTTNKYEFVGFIGFFFAFSWTIFLTVRRYPLRIYRRDDDYVAVFEGFVPFLRRKLPFARGQVEPMPPKGIMPWKDNRYTFNGVRTILVENYFKTPAELNRMISDKYRYY